MKGSEAESSLALGASTSVCGHVIGVGTEETEDVSSVSLVQLRPNERSTLGFLSITDSQSLLKLMSFKSVMPSNHCILCHPHLLLPSIFPSIRVFSMSARECIMHTRELSMVKVQRLSQNPLSYPLKEQASVCNDQGH